MKGMIILLSLELKNIFINPQDGDWDAIGEQINSGWGGTKEELESGNWHALDRITLYLNICLPNGENMEGEIEIDFEKTEEEFLKEFQYWNEYFPTYSYEEDMKKKKIYGTSEYDYITNYLKEKINKSYNKLKEKGYIAT